MRVDVITLFPDLVNSVTCHGVTGRAADRKLLELHCWNPRDYAHDVHRSVDDRPYGGGPGMVMKADCLLPALRDARKANAQHCGLDERSPRVIYLSPQGRPLTQATLQVLSEQRGVVLLCGRYEGIDQRVIDLEVDEEWSLGDYALSGGELGAMVVIDAVARLLPGVLGHELSALEDSFTGALEGMLDCPHYTRPEVIEGLEVPAILKSGDHQAIARWRREQREKKTRWRQQPNQDTNCAKRRFTRL